MARDCRRPPITMKEVEKLPAAGERRPEGEQEEQLGNFPLSFAAVVKSNKFLEDSAKREREVARRKEEEQTKKATEERKREEDKRAREQAQAEKAEQKQQEDEARRSAHLAELAKVVETAVLHKKYVKNLHSQAQAELKETTEYEKDLENMVKPVGESSKRLASTSLEATPLAKKTLQTPNL